MTAAIFALGAGLLAGPVGEARRDLPPARATLPVIEVRGTRAAANGPFPIASTVLGRQDIARRPGGDLADLLPSVPGLRLVSRGDPGLGAFVSLRGSTSEQVLVLVDGRRVNAAQGGGVDLSTIPLDSIERVEIQRGGASAAWGPDAIGGAIHVVTKDAGARPPRLRLAGGTGGARDAAGEASVGIASGWRARGGGRWARARGDAPVAGGDAHIANADWRRTTADVAIEGAIRGGRLRADASVLRSERGVPGSTEFPTPSARLDDTRDGGALRYEFGTMGLANVGSAAGDPDAAARARWTLDAAAFEQDRRYAEPDAALGAIDETHHNRRLEATFSGAGARGLLAWSAATGASRDRLTSTTDGRRSRDATFVRAQLVRDASWTGRRWRGVVSARADALSGFATQWSPRLGAEADLVPGALRARASAGYAFRPPTFDDLFWPARASAAGNPDLRPETARDADIGILWTSSDGRRRATAEAFLRRMDDLIQWAPGAGGVWRPHNVGQARLAGVESEISLRTPAASWGSVEFAGTLSRLATRDDSGEPNVDGRELVYRPRWTATASIVFARSSRFEIESFARFVDHVWTTRANTKQLDGYALADLRARVRPLPGVALDLAVTNLFDRAARDFRYFPLPGRGAEIGLTLEGASR